MSGRNVENIRKIAVLRFSSMGDVIMTTAMVRCLRKRFPGAQIDMVVRSDFADLIRYNPHIDQKITLDRRSGVSGLLALYRRLNREHYDVIYDAHRSLRTRFLMPALKADWKIEYAKHYLRRNAALTFKVPRLRDNTRMLERFIQPLSPLGVEYDGGGPEVFSHPQVDQAVSEKVALPPSGGIVGLVPSAQWEGKRWPLKHFHSLAKKILEETENTLLVFGGPEDGFCESLCQDLPPTRVLNLQGKLNLMETISVMKRCHVVVANDTGLMHMADALNVPSVVIMGPTSAQLGCAPFHPLARMVEQELWCRPCSKNGQAPCIRKERYCLERTTPEKVFQIVSNTFRLLLTEPVG